MNIILIVKIKNIVILLGFFAFFAFFITPTNKTEDFTFFEAFSMAVFFPIAEYYLFSNYMYNSLIEYGYKIKYNFYQIIGLVFVSVVSIIAFLASIGCCPAN